MECQRCCPSHQDSTHSRSLDLNKMHSHHLHPFWSPSPVPTLSQNAYLIPSPIPPRHAPLSPPLSARHRPRQARGTESSHPPPSRRDRQPDRGSRESRPPLQRPRDRLTRSTGILRRRHLLLLHRQRRAPRKPGFSQRPSRTHRYGPPCPGPWNGRQAAGLGRVRLTCSRRNDAAARELQRLDVCAERPRGPSGHDEGVRAHRRGGQRVLHARE